MNGFETTFDKFGYEETRRSFFNGTLEEYCDDQLPAADMRYAFASMSSLSKVVLPNCSILGSYAFANCHSLRELSIPMVTTLPYGVFSGCNFSDISIYPSHIGIIAEAGFSGCTSLKEASSETIYQISAYAFSGCIALERISFRHSQVSTISIYNNAFRGCGALSIVDAPINWIGDNAFYECKSLKSFSKVGTAAIGAGAFYGCTDLSVFYLNTESCNLTSSTAFQSTKITFATGSIYVPASRVDYYRQSTNWNWFSTQIFGYDYENDRPVD